MTERIREYEFLESLGKGGMGEVFKARHVLRDRLFAVKVIRKELGADPQHRQRFLREARILLDLDHPAIVRSLDVFEEQERLYLVMELLEGEPLSAFLARATPRFAAGRLLLTPILEAVAHAHRLGIVHRDLKPANVFIRKDGSVKVLDFGLAKELGDASLTTTGQGLGTPAYMAPEVFTGERKIAEIGPEGDVYALGVIAYRLFTGRMPFNLPEDASSLEAVAHLTRHYVSGKPAPDIAAICPEMPKPFARAVMAALAVNPAARLKDAGELLRLTAPPERQEKATAEPSRKIATSGVAGVKGADPTAPSDDDTIIHSLPKFQHPPSTFPIGGRQASPESPPRGEVSPGQRTDLKDQAAIPKPATVKKWLPALAVLAVILVVAGIMTFGHKGADTQRPAEPVRSAAAPSPQPPPVATPAKAAYVDSMTGMEFVFVKGGCFQMGDTFGDGDADEKPVHEVCVKDYYLGRHEVTVGQFKNFVNATGYKTDGEKGGGSFGLTGNEWKMNPKLNWRNPGFTQDDNHPVTCVSWNDARAFAVWLSRKAGRKFRLPTEAEWEYAARSGGQQEKWAGTSTEADLGQYAWYGRINGSATHPVGQKRPNGVGLYDMSGNVGEWCQDWFGDKYYGSKIKENPKGPKAGDYRVLRGGSCYDIPRYVRAATRDMNYPDYRYFYLGFRLVLSPQD